MDTAQIEIQGIEEVCGVLDKFPKVLVATAFNKGLSECGAVYRQALQTKTPYDLLAVANKAHGGFGVPLRAFPIMEVWLDSQLRGGGVDIGFGKLWHIAMWVEEGHVLKGRTSKRFGDFIPPHPFMLPVSTSYADAAVRAFEDSVISTLRGGLAGIPTPYLNAARTT